MDINTKYNINEMLMYIYKYKNEDYCMCIGKVCGIVLLNRNGTNDIYYLLDSTEDAYGQYQYIKETDLTSLNNYNSQDIIRLLISMGYQSFESGRIYKTKCPTEQERNNTIYLQGYNYLHLHNDVVYNWDKNICIFPQLKDYI